MENVFFSDSSSANVFLFSAGFLLRFPICLQDNAECSCGLVYLFNFFYLRCFSMFHRLVK